jgi:hypothetical protein
MEEREKKATEKGKSEKKGEAAAWEVREVSEKEKRIRALTNVYYAKPEVQKAILEFARDREVVPRYFEGFGKRPDILQYNNDIIGLVKRGATSFHSSEEIWHNPLNLNSDMQMREMNDLRKSWDLLIDIDSPFLDFSKIAAKLLIKHLEGYGIRNYGIKFSGSKGFHIIVSGRAFPREFDGKQMSESFPEWPRAICEYLIEKIKPDYNREIGKQDINFKALEKRTKLTKEELTEIICPNCSALAKKGMITKYICNDCGDSIERKDVKSITKKLKCLNKGCGGILEVLEQKDYFICEACGETSWEKLAEGKGKMVLSDSAKESTNYNEGFEEGISGNKLAGFDLVLVASRHLFRMPYSLHEKTALASVVLEKEEIENFNPRDADPWKVKTREFYPMNEENEARRLLVDALAWKKTQKDWEEKEETKKYSGMKTNFEDEKIEGVTDEMFPKPIAKLLKGLEDGKKRGLFVLLTFFKSIGFSAAEINERVKKWNEKNSPPLREGYVRAQIDWHMKQKKKILPPNYENAAFYKDLGLLDKKPEVKNPLVEVKRNLWKFKNGNRE